ncbi:hypothetical protein ShzoTeo12_37920 (plasmid) [Shinella zoogloeoides]|nr:hypothetical protein ShzoTeo12_37920 [Shinella zoogloeoides]
MGAPFCPFSPPAGRRSRQGDEGQLLEAYRRISLNGMPEASAPTYFGFW